MTDDEVIKMAHEAGLSITPPRSGQYNGGQIGCDVVGLTKFASLVAAHEREDCAKVCESLDELHPPVVAAAFYKSAAAIRARSGI